MFYEYMERLIEAVTTKDFSEEVIKAKEEYFSKAGGIFDDDKSFENRMVSFTEWYCFDRRSKKYQKIPLDHFIDANTPTWNKEEIDIYTGFLKNIHSIFHLKKIQKGQVVIKDLHDSKKFTVSQKQSNLFYKRGTSLKPA